MSGTRISALPPLANLADGAILPVVNAGVNYKVTGLAIKNFLAVPVTNRYYVDPSRTDVYIESGSELFPFKMVTSALIAVDVAILAGLNPQTNPVYVILKGSTTENITLTNGRVYLCGENGSIHTPIYVRGTVTVNANSGTVSQNRIGIFGISISAVGSANALYLTGVNPTNLFLQEVWLQSNNTTNTTGGFVQDNTGTGSTTNADVLKISQGGSGDVYCINIQHGSANFNEIETSGATQVAAVQSGASLTLNSSELDANGDVIAETYGTGSLTITNSVLTNTKANSNGIQINSAGSTVVLGNVIMTVPVGTGKAVWYDPAATAYGSNLAYAGIVFTSGSNTTIDTRLTPIPQVNAFGAGVGNVIGDITGNINKTGTAAVYPSSTTLNIGSSVVTGTYNLATGITATGLTKSINIGTNSATGSTTAIAIGSILGTSSVQVNGALTVTGNITGNVTGNIDKTGTAAAYPSATTLNIGSSVVTGTYNLATGITATGLTKSINIGTNSATGSTTSIAIGSVLGTSSVQVNGDLKLLAVNSIQFSSTSHYAHQSLPTAVIGSTSSTGAVSLDLWQLHVPNTGNRSVQFTLASGAVGAAFVGSVTATMAGVATASTITGTSSGSWQYFNATYNFGDGDVAVYTLSDITNSKTYRVTVVYATALTSSITIERIA